MPGLSLILSMRCAGEHASLAWTGGSRVLSDDHLAAIISFHKHHTLNIGTAVCGLHASAHTYLTILTTRVECLLVEGFRMRGRGGGASSQGCTRLR